MTEDESVVSLNKVFATGQSYVALNRVRTLAGLIATNFKDKAIYCNDTVKESIVSMTAFLVKKPMAAVDGLAQQLTEHSASHSVHIDSYTLHSCPCGLCHTFNHPKLSKLQVLEHGDIGLYSVDNSDFQIPPNFDLECLVCLHSEFSIAMAFICLPPCYPVSLFKCNMGKLVDWSLPIAKTRIVMGDLNENLLKSSSICEFMEANNT